METSAYVKINRDRRLADDEATGHNRWHPQIEPVIRVNPGDVVALETRDAFDGQINPDSTIDELGRLSLGRVHPMTGPVYVNGAEPGDILEVDVLDVVPERSAFTIQGPVFGFLRDIMTENYLVRWHLENDMARSEELPGVTISGAPFMGVMGVAPSLPLLREITSREAKLAATGVFVLQPDAREAVPGTGPAASEGLSSLPPREFGGNIDVKQLTAGATLRLPVHVQGALFSTGDAHFSQGDNECCTAIEMGATLYCSFRVTKQVVSKRELTDPEFYRSVALANDPVRRHEHVEARQYHATTGFCRNQAGQNFSEDLNLAARNALLNMIEYLKKEREYSAQQAYAICSVAVDLHISEAVNLPNFLVSAFLPLDIFD
jgi:formamidase